MSDNTRGLGKLKEEGQDDEVREIASQGGQASKGGQSSMSDDSSQQQPSSNSQQGGQTFAKDPSLASKAGQKGGKAAHEAGTAHEFTSEEASDAGRDGGSK